MSHRWTSWHVSRPFSDPEGAAAWLRQRTRQIEEAPFEAGRARDDYRRYMLDLQSSIGDTVILNFSRTGGMFVASSSEINPPIPPENFRAMVETAWEEKAER